MMTAVPGLLAKIWLRNADENTYGGVYLWEEQAACENFLTGELWGEVLKDDSVQGITSHDYAVMEELTKTTQPVMAMV